jgi:hypothetical protein
MRCPRCETENDALARSCGGCALPLAIAEEGAVEPVERVIEIDRRGPRASSPRASPTLRYAQGERDVSDRAVSDPGAVPVRAERRAAEPPVVEARPIAVPEQREPEPDRELELEPEPDLDPDPDPDLDLDPDLDPPPRARRALARLLDAAVVSAAAAIPLALASGGHAGAALRHAPGPAAGLLAILAVAYVGLCHALAGATLGRLALFTKSGRSPRDRAPGTAGVRA